AEKILQLAIQGTAAFRKDYQRHASLQGLHSAIEAGQSRAQAGAVHWDLAGALQIPSNEWDFEEVVPRQNAKLEGQLVQDDWRIHVGQVIRHIHRRLAGLEIFRPDHAHWGERDAQNHAAPRFRDG